MLAALEHVLHRADAGDEQPEPEPVDAALGLLRDSAGSGMNAIVMKNAAMPIGMLTRNNSGHVALSMM